jgi:hypothetical protein
VKSKSLIGILIIGCVAAFTWVVGSQIGVSVLHGKTQFSEWRTHHVGILVVFWLLSVVVISLPILFVVGRRMLAAMTEREESVAASKGVGRLAIRALQGKTDAADKLVMLLKDPTPAVRYQAARALAFLDDDDVNPTLFKVVRYWTGKDKMALIDTLRRTQDVRCGKMLMELTHDRSPNVSRHAMRALPMVMGSTWRGPTKEEDERASRKRGGSRVTSGTVPSIMADLPARVKEKEDRPLISGTPQRTKPVAKPATEGAAAGTRAASPPAPRRPAPKPKPAVEHVEATPAAGPATPPPA